MLSFSTTVLVLFYCSFTVLSLLSAPVLKQFLSFLIGMLAGSAEWRDVFAV